MQACNCDDVSLDKPIPEGLSLASVTGSNKRLRKLQILRNLRNLRIVGAGVHAGVQVYAGQSITLKRVGGTDFGTGQLLGQYCDGVTLNDYWQEGTTLTQRSYGPACSFAECRKVLLNRPHARSVLHMVDAEAGAEVCVIIPHFENTVTVAAGVSLGRQVTVFGASGRGKISIHNATVTGFCNYLLSETSNGTASAGASINFSGNQPADPSHAALQHPAGVH